MKVHILIFLVFLLQTHASTLCTGFPGVYCDGCNQACPDGNVCPNCPIIPTPTESIYPCQNVIDFVTTKVGLIAPCHDFMIPNTNFFINTCGYRLDGTTNDLFVKNSMDVDEKGLGLNEDPRNDHEISSISYVQFDTVQIQSLSLKPKVMMSSTTNGELYEFYGSNTRGNIGQLLYTGDKQMVFIDLPGYASYRYISVKAGGPVDGTNVIVSKLLFACISPTNSPTIMPSRVPSMTPTRLPTRTPSTTPSLTPTDSPTVKPTQSPTMNPTTEPSSNPSTTPSRLPSMKPSISPSLKPSYRPTGQPTGEPTSEPTKKPTRRPTSNPTNQPTVVLTTSPTTTPSLSPSIAPTTTPSMKPSYRPTGQPTSEPTSEPTKKPTRRPTIKLSTQPTLVPTFIPTTAPTSAPVKPNFSCGDSSINFSTYTEGPLPVCENFNIDPSDNVPIRICGYYLNGTSTELYIKHEDTANEQGLGLNENIKGGKEIPTYGFVQMDFIQLNAVPIDIQVMMGSTQSQEMFKFYGSNTAGVLGDFLDSGDMQMEFYPLPGYPTYRFISIIADGTKNNNNVLLNKLSFPCHINLDPTSEPTLIPVNVPTDISTVTPTILPSMIPTYLPSDSPSNTPTLDPTVKQTTLLPTSMPTVIDTTNLSNTPTLDPTVKQTTLLPTSGPTVIDTTNLSNAPTMEPTILPTLIEVVISSSVPTVTETTNISTAPSIEPTKLPTMIQTNVPTSEPSIKQSSSIQPTYVSTTLPSTEPTNKPSFSPTTEPTIYPSMKPTNKPITQPSYTPTRKPNRQPTMIPTFSPTEEQSIEPTFEPSIEPTISPTTTTTTTTTLKTPLIIPCEPVGNGRNYSDVGIFGASFFVFHTIDNIDIAQLDGNGASFSRTIQCSLNGPYTIQPVDVSNYAVRVKSGTGANSGSSSSSGSNTNTNRLLAMSVEEANGLTFIPMKEDDLHNRSLQSSSSSALTVSYKITYMFPLTGTNDTYGNFIPYYEKLSSQLSDMAYNTHTFLDTYSQYCIDPVACLNANTTIPLKFFGPYLLTPAPTLAPNTITSSSKGSITTLIQGNLGIILGTSIGLFCILLLIIVVNCVYMRRRKDREDKMVKWQNNHTPNGMFLNKARKNNRIDLSYDTYTASEYSFDQDSTRYYASFSQQKSPQQQQQQQPITSRLSEDRQDRRSFFSSTRFSISPPENTTNTTTTTTTKKNNPLRHGRNLRHTNDTYDDEDEDRYSPNDSSESDSTRLSMHHLQHTTSGTIHDLTNSPHLTSPTLSPRITQQTATNTTFNSNPISASMTDRYSWLMQSYDDRDTLRTQVGHEETL